MLRFLSSLHHIISAHNADGCTAGALFWTLPFWLFFFFTLKPPVGVQNVKSKTDCDLHKDAKVTTEKKGVSASR